MLGVDGGAADADWRGDWITRQWGRGQVNSKGESGSIQGRAKLPERLYFQVAGHSGHDVSGQAADHMALVGGKIELANDQRNDRAEGVPVVETKGSQTMAAAAKINGLVQTHGFAMIVLPKRSRDVMAVRGRLVQGVLRCAEHGILRGHHFPRERCKPWLFWLHGLFARRFRFCLDPLQFLNAFTLEITFPSPGINRFCGKAMLDSQPFGYQLLEERILEQLGIDRRRQVRFHRAQHTPSAATAQSRMMSESA